MCHTSDRRNANACSDKVLNDPAAGLANAPHCGLSAGERQIGERYGDAYSQGGAEPFAPPRRQGATGDPGARDPRKQAEEYRTIRR